MPSTRSPQPRQITDQPNPVHAVTSLTTRERHFHTMQPLTKIFTILLLLTTTILSATATSAQSAATPTALALDNSPMWVSRAELTASAPDDVPANRETHKPFGNARDCVVSSWAIRFCTPVAPPPHGERPEAHRQRQG